MDKAGPMGRYQVRLVPGLVSNAPLRPPPAAWTIDGMAATKGRRVAMWAAGLVLAVLAVAAWLSWPHLRFWWLFEPLGTNAQGLPEYRHRQTGIVMVRVPGGTFWMGAQKEDPKGRNYDPDAQPEESPVHDVTLRPFLIGKYEVTQAEWQRVTGSNPSAFKGEHLPVENDATWFACQEFSERVGLKLPTEAQWEYACRAKSSGPFAGTGRLDEMGWYRGNSGGKTHARGEKRPNDFGLCDMHGNIWEWCEDHYDGGFYSDPEGRNMDPLCNRGSELRVARGGNHDNRPIHCRSAARLGGPPAAPGAIGLRVAFYPLP